MLINDYYEFSISRTGINASFQPMASYGIHFKLHCDVSPLFPYIKSEIDDAVVFNNPEYIQFVHGDSKCTIYPFEVIALPFKGEEEARRFIDDLILFLNSLHERKHEISPNHQTFNQVSVPDLYKLLPGNNCRKCGYHSCLAFAAHLSVSETTPDQCPHFCKPIRKINVYPIIDSDGNLTSTVNIETSGMETSGKDSDKAKNKVPLKISSTGVKAELTQREIQVLAIMAKGATNMDISEKLAISPHTVKSHVIHIFNKLGVNDRTQAAVWASKNNII